MASLLNCDIDNEAEANHPEKSLSPQNVRFKIEYTDVCSRFPITPDPVFETLSPFEFSPNLQAMLNYCDADSAQSDSPLSYDMMNDSTCIFGNLLVICIVIYAFL